MKKYRHGDLICQQIAAVPSGAKKLDKKVPFAYGEKSGHVHVLTGDYDVFEIDGKFVTVVNGDGARLQHIHESSLTPMAWHKKDEISQADHGSIVIEQGIYEFYIQNEYNPFSKHFEKVID